MKLNLTLLTLLVAILFFVYYFEEKKTIENQEMESKKFAFLDKEISLKTLKKLSLPNVLLQEGSCTKGLKQAYSPDSNVSVDDKCFFIVSSFENSEQEYAANSSKVDDFLQVLSKFKVMRYLSVEEKKDLKRDEIFPKDSITFSLYFLNKNITYTLGKRLDFDETFYFEIKDSENLKMPEKVEWVIVKDEAEKSGLYSEEEDKKQEAYQNLKALLSKPMTDYLEKNPLSKHFFHHDVEQFNFQKITISNKFNREFFLQWQGSDIKSSPEILKGIAFRNETIDEFKKRLKNLHSIDVYFNGKNDKKIKFDELASTIKVKLFNGQINQDVDFQLFRKIEIISGIKNKNKISRKGYFLITSLSDNVFELSESDSTIFFANVQDFWDKRVQKFLQLQKLQLI
ncbi:MAG: hypothetical protein HQK51_00800, partial [Oligoflexia bacterium]|nr:hypothetical protein [Oligoflexia bacterium]